jgi:hypothetical protein
LESSLKIATNIPNDVDAYAILTEWEDFKNLVISKKPIFDGRNLLKGKTKMNIYKLDKSYS